MNTSYIFVDNDTLALNIDGKPYTVDANHQNWDEIVDAVRDNNFGIIPGLINLAKAVQEFVGFSNIVVNAEYGTITYAGTPLHTAIVDHIFRMKDEGFDIKPMLRFLDNLMANPSKRAVDELYGFLQYGKMPITEDGCFIAYKRVRDDYKSVHDGKTDNTPGTRLDMPRNLVNENSNETCSTGLHFCSHEYLKSFSGEKVVILKINPRDVVSIPADYNNTKGRACGYDIIGELTPDEVKKALSENVFVDAVYGAVAEKATTGPKAGASAFYHGYETGYNAGISGADYDDGNNFLGRQADAYEEGYAKGYHHGDDGISRQYVLDDNGLMQHTSPRLPSYDDRQMYDAGYRDGRARMAARITVDGAAYTQGYKDGRAHRPRKYK